MHSEGLSCRVPSLTKDPRSPQCGRGAIETHWGHGSHAKDQCQPREQRVSDKRPAFWGFLGGAVVKNPPANAGDTGSSPGPGRSHMPQSN